MNQRIKQLAEEAGLVPGIMGLNRFTHFDTEKFAELIINECARIVNDNDFEGSQLGNGLLFEHFGGEDDKTA